MGCTVEGCNKPHIARGWCHTHYKRWQVHGDPLASAFKHKASNGDVDRFIEALPSEGDSCVIWPFTRNNKGYATRTLYNRQGTRSVCRYICEKFHGTAPAPHYQAAHSCGRGHLGCVAPWHLSWKTPRDNNADMDVHGTRIRGESVTGAKLTARDIAVIRGILTNKYVPRSAVAYMFGVTESAISAIIRRRNWKHVEAA